MNSIKKWIDNNGHLVIVISFIVWVLFQGIQTYKHYEVQESQLELLELQKEYAKLKTEKWNIEDTKE